MCLPCKARPRPFLWGRGHAQNKNAQSINTQASKKKLSLPCFMVCVQSQTQRRRYLQILLYLLFMPKKNNSGKSTGKLSQQQLEAQLLALFTENPTKPYNAERLVRDMGVSNNKDSMQHVLQRMADKQLIMASKGGDSYILYDAVSPNQAEVRGEKKKKSEDRATGVVDITRSGAAFIESKDSGLSKDIFVPQARIGNALHGDRVEVRWWLSSRGKPEGEVTRVLERHAEQFIGTLVVAKHYTFVVPDTQNMMFDIVVDPESLPANAKEGDKVIVAVHQWHNPRRNDFTLKGKIVAVLGKAGTSDIEMKSILLECGFPITFPDAVLRENEAIAEEIPAEEIARRTDFRSVLTITIDPLTAKDFDDAISLQTLENGNLQIGVHIADVAYYVAEQSELDKEAAKRTTSVYLVDRVLPMLPEKLSNGVCSLRPNEDKLTFSAVFEFTKKGEIVNEWFGRTIIHSDRRFTYEEAQECIETKKGDYAKEVIQLNQIAQKMRKARFKSGAINFETNETQFTLDETGKPIGIYTKVRKDAHFLVEEFMLLANRRVATYIVEANKKLKTPIPFVYRIHDLPDMEKIAAYVQFVEVFGYEMKIKSPKTISQSFGKLMKEIEGKPESDVLQNMAIRTMAKAAYSTNNIGHYGLAFDNYSHFTSPIRRYADVLTHRLLADYLDKKPIRISPDTLEETCQYIGKKERKAMEAERASVKYKQVEFLQDHIGRVFQGVITGMTERGIYVEIIENRCEGLISFDNMYDTFRLRDAFHIESATTKIKMGDIVWVRVLMADLAKRHINMLLLSEQEEDDEDLLAAAQAERKAREVDYTRNHADLAEQANTATRIEEMPVQVPVEEKAEPTEKAVEERPAKGGKKAKEKATKEPKATETKPAAETKAEPKAEPKAEVKAEAKAEQPAKGGKKANLHIPKGEIKAEPKAEPKAEVVAPVLVKETAPAVVVTKETVVAKPTQPAFLMQYQQQMAAAFGKSTLKALAESNGSTWGVCAGDTPLAQEALYFLDFNPAAFKGEQYPLLSPLPEDAARFQKSTVYQQSRSLIEEYLSEGEAESVGHLYAFPLRSEEEEQVDEAEFAKFLPAFTQLLQSVRPTRLVSYSTHLCEMMLKYGKLEQVQREQVESGKRMFPVMRAMLRLGSRIVPIAFLPSLRVKIDRDARRLAWAWALPPI